tara:strand:- start:201 stop:1301 length:1101 start_codon:yes stop_codon:yes gene_type:complete
MRTGIDVLRKVLGFSFLVLASTAQVQGKEANFAFEISDVIVQPGEAYSGSIHVPAGDDQIESKIPITVHNGAYRGPVLTLIAGIHGSEYAPILAMQDLARTINPTHLSGTIIIVHIANLPAFVGRTIYFGPNDLKNLNRSFPGSLSGSVTERIAFVLTHQIIKRSDFVIDIHAGDGNESLRPSYSAYYAEAGGEEVIRLSRRIAIAFGLETIVLFSGSYDSVEDAIYTSSQAVTLGIPAIDVESGERGLIDGQYVDPITVGVINVMRELEMIVGSPESSENPLFISDRVRLKSDHNGIWSPDSLVKTGDYINAGTRLGVISDYHGNELETITASESGVLLVFIVTPPINKGEDIAVIGKLSAEKDL